MPLTRVDRRPKGADDAPRRGVAYLTPRQVADRLGLAKTDAVLAWIARGELAAVNVSAGRRPTWRIDPADLAAFLAGRRAVPMPSRDRRVRPKPAAKVTAYF